MARQDRFWPLARNPAPLGMCPMMPDPWEWPIVSFERPQGERIALMRAIPYETAGAMERALAELTKIKWRRGKALSLNMSAGGMLLIKDWAPALEERLSLQVPTPPDRIPTPTRAEVRWVRRVPFSLAQDLHFVGLQFPPPARRRIVIRRSE